MLGLIQMYQLGWVSREELLKGLAREETAAARRKKASKPPMDHCAAVRPRAELCPGKKHPHPLCRRPAAVTPAPLPLRRCPPDPPAHPSCRSQLAPGVRQAVRWIARLGGFLGRKRDGESGPVTLWRGLHRLHDLTALWRLFHAKNQKQKCAQ